MMILDQEAKRSGEKQEPILTGSNNASRNNIKPLE